MKKNQVEEGTMLSQIGDQVRFTLKPWRSKQQRNFPTVYIKQRQEDTKVIFTSEWSGRTYIKDKTTTCYLV